MNANFNKLIIFLLIIVGSTIKAEVQKEVKFLTFNLWQEGTEVANGLEKIRNVIIEAKPDIVCFVEVRNYDNEDWTEKIIKALSDKGYDYEGKYAGGDVSLISKFPITDSELVYNGNGSIVNFDVDINGKSIKIACAHLDYIQYACYLPRGYNGGTPNWNMIDDGQGNPVPVTDINEILVYNLESDRNEQIEAFLKNVNNETRPVILMGDFNEPSHLDWTKKTANMFDHNGVVMQWQSTKALFDNNFKDAFRECFPNEVSNPGITWPSFVHGKKSTSWTPKSDERDRIDYIFYKGEGIKTVHATLVGPKESYAYGKLTDSDTVNENFMASDLEWPSDHKAVMAILKFSF